jgi:hypothetical protein
LPDCGTHAKKLALVSKSKMKRKAGEPKVYIR